MIQVEEKKIGQITWILGQSGAGKTSLAISISKNGPEESYKNAICLDGDSMRTLWKHMGLLIDLSKTGRKSQNLRVAYFARFLANQGHNVIVSVICPYKELRKKVKDITNCKFIYIEGGKEGNEYPFDYPELY